MKESDIKGLAELKEDYGKRVQGLKEYQELADQLHKKTLDLVQKTLSAKGIDLKQTAVLKETTKGDCGFCSACITDCSGCVCYN